MNHPSPVDFLIVGAQKCGTSMLHNVLRAHPEIYMPATKELHYFDRVQQYPEDEWYADQFKDSQGRLRGEATPIYCYWPNAMQRVAHVAPRAKIVMILRNPIQRAISQYRMESGRGTDNLSFHEALLAENIRINGQDEQSRRNHSYIDRGRYRRQVANIFRNFPQEQVHLMRLEDMASEGRLRKLAMFLGIDSALLPERPPVVFAADNINHEVSIESMRILNENLNEECSAIDRWFSSENPTLAAANELQNITTNKY